MKINIKLAAICVGLGIALGAVVLVQSGLALPDFGRNPAPIERYGALQKDCWPRANPLGTPTLSTGDDSWRRGCILQVQGFAASMGCKGIFGIVEDNYAWRGKGECTGHRASFAVDSRGMFGLESWDDKGMK